MDRQQSLADWFSAANSKRLLGTAVAPYAQGTSYGGTWNRWEPNAFAQVVKVKAGCIAMIRGEETEDFSFKQP
jgi:hypothetical protein